MRELAIGDIHGCARSLEALLKTIQPGRTDTVVLLGDYIDRGPDSCAVLDMILNLQQRCNMVALTGNHEMMLLEARQEPTSARDWLAVGGNATLDSYQRRGLGWTVQDIPEPHWNFLAEQTRNYWETRCQIYVHASLDPALDMEEQPEDLLFWEKFKDPTLHKSGKEIICGHTSQKSGLPAVFKGGICIDTWVYGMGWLTCFDTINRTFVQTNERGQRRKFDLAELPES
jgi:serine/threonine protein phosphatase 1